jgi:nucleosome binding factor SPN SPT16 subunit
MTEWDDSYKLIKADLEEQDVSPGIAMALSVKDEDEQVPPQRDSLMRNPSVQQAKPVLFY